MAGIIDFLESGGVFMYPLALLSVATITIILERLFTEGSWRKYVKYYLEYIKARKPGNTKIPSELRLDDLFSQSSARRREIVVAEKLQLIFDKRVRVNEIISSIGNTAPLLGFIGTVSGMIHSFSAIANADKVSIKLVATGISEALITTGFGLSIAAFCIVADSLLRFRFVKFSHQIEGQVTNIMNEVNQEISRSRQHEHEHSHTNDSEGSSDASFHNFKIGHKRDKI